MSELVIHWIRLFGQPLFQAQDPQTIVKLNKDREKIEELRRKISSELNDFQSKINKNGLNLLLSLLEVDKEKRISASQALKHPFFELINKRMIKFGSSKDMIYETIRSSWDENESQTINPFPNTRVRQPSAPDRKSVFSGHLTIEKPGNSPFRDRSGTISTISCGNSPANNFNFSFNLNLHSFCDYLSHESCLTPTLKSPSSNHQRRSTKGYTTQGYGAYNSQNFLKAAILSNMQKNGEDGSPIKVDRRHHTDYSSIHNNNIKKPTIILPKMTLEDGLDVNIEDYADDENHLNDFMESLNGNNSNPIKSIRFN